MRCTRLAALAFFALALALGGCTGFRTTDVYRPLILAEFPQGERIRSLHSAYFAETDSEAFEHSLDLTRATWRVWGIQKYQSFYADLDIQRLVEALSEHEGNAFAWTQLGAYLALQHRPAAGAEATRRALDLLDEIDDLDGADELIELKRISTINLAIYHNTAGQPRSALHALARLEADELVPFHRLAFYWAKAQAHTALGEFDASREALAAARTTAESGLDSVLGSVDYPQYFKRHKREALFRYLQAAILRAEGRYDESIAELNRALAGDHRLWDARFLRALAYKETGNLSLAHHEFKALGADVPGSLFRREAIYYHLALVLIEQDELEAAENALARAVELVRGGNQRLRKGLEEAADAGVSQELARVLATAYQDDGWNFPPAFEALGEAYLARLDRRGQSRGYSAFAAAAERMFQIALGERGFPEDGELLYPPSDRDSIVHYATHATLGTGEAHSLVEVAGFGGAGTNPHLPGASSYGRRHVTLERVARMHWQEEEYDPALARFSEALWTAAGDPRILASLVELGCRAPDPEIARRAYNLALEHLPLAAPYGVESAIGRVLQRALTDAPQAAGSEELDHLEARLLLLQGNLEAAEAAFGTAERAYPDSVWPLVGRVWVELNRDQLPAAGAAESLGRALEVQRNSEPRWQLRDAHFVLAELRLTEGDTEGARAELEAAAALEPGWTVLREWIDSVPMEAPEAEAEAASEPKRR